MKSFTLRRVIATLASALTLPALIVAPESASATGSIAMHAPAGLVAMVPSLIPTAVVSKPTVSVTGKYCPKLSAKSSVYKRTLLISRSKPKGALLCVIRVSDDSNGVETVFTTTIRKRSNNKVGVTLSLTRFRQEVHYAEANYRISAYADAVRLDNVWDYVDEQARMSYPSVSGKAFWTQGQFLIVQEIFDSGWQNSSSDFLWRTPRLHFNVKTIK